MFPAPLTPPSSDGNRATWIVLKKLTSLHFLLCLAFTDAHCICGSLRGAGVDRHSAGKTEGWKESPQVGMSTTSARPSCQSGVPDARLGAWKAYLNFQSPFLAAGECPYHGFLHATGWETQSCSPVLAEGSSVGFAEPEEFVLA